MKADTQRLLIAAGVGCAVVYIGLDLVAASIYPGYSIRDQAISELSAVGAPTARLWSTVSPVFAVLLVAFGVGLWRIREYAALHLTGALVLALAAIGPLWAVFPMHQRGAAAGASDVGHIVLSAVSVLLIVSFMVAGAAGVGGRFRAISSLMAAAVLVAFGATFALAGRLAANEPTPWLGIIERVAIYGYLVWIAMLAAVLLRRQRFPHMQAA